MRRGGPTPRRDLQRIARVAAYDLEAGETSARGAAPDVERAVEALRAEGASPAPGAVCVLTPAQHEACMGMLEEMDRTMDVRGSTGYLLGDMLRRAAGANARPPRPPRRPTTRWQRAGGGPAAGRRNSPTNWDWVQKNMGEDFV